MTLDWNGELRRAIAVDGHPVVRHFEQVPVSRSGSHSSPGAGQMAPDCLVMSPPYSPQSEVIFSPPVSTPKVRVFGLVPTGPSVTRFHIRLPVEIEIPCRIFIEQAHHKATVEQTIPELARGL